MAKSPESGCTTLKRGTRRSPRSGRTIIGLDRENPAGKADGKFFSLPNIFASVTASSLTRISASMSTPVREGKGRRSGPLRRTPRDRPARRSRPRMARFRGIVPRIRPGGGPGKRPPDCGSGRGSKSWEGPGRPESSMSSWPKARTGIRGRDPPRLLKSQDLAPPRFHHLSPPHAQARGPCWAAGRLRRPGASGATC